MQSEGPTEPPPAVRGFSLRLSLGAVAVVSVALAIGLRDVPWLGIPLALVLGPATVRTSLAMNKRRAAGLSVNGDERALAFMASVFVMVATLAASSTAFCCACIPVGMIFFDLHGPGNVAGMVSAFGLGFLAAGTAAFFLLRWLWPQRPPLVNHWPPPKPSVNAESQKSAPIGEAEPPEITS